MFCNRRLTCVPAFLSATLVAVTTLHALGQHRDNAADRYREAFAMLERLSPGEMQLLADFASSPSATLTSDVQAALRHAQPAIRALQQASSMEHIDWGIDYSEGVATRLPHLGSVRQGARVLIAQARADVLSGDMSGATNAMAAGLRVSHHATSDPVAISTLVGASIFAMVDNDVLADAVGNGLIAQKDAQQLLATMQTLVEDDPLGLVAAFENERAWVSSSMIDEYVKGEKTADHFVDEFGEFLDPSMAAAIASMNDNELRASALGFDMAMDDMISAVETGDLAFAQREAARIERAVADGRYGPMAQLFMASFTRVIEAMRHSYGRMDVLMDELGVVAASPDGQRAMRNAALWYRRAIGMHDLLSASEWRHIERLTEAHPVADLHLRMAGAKDDLNNEGLDVDDRSNRERDDTLDAILLKAAPILDILDEATMIDRCNFERPRDNWNTRGLRVVLDHVPGMQRNAALLHVSGVRSSDAHRRTRRAVQLLRMSVHQGTDGYMLSVRSAARMADLGFDLLIESDDRVMARAGESEVAPQNAGDAGDEESDVRVALREVLRHAGTPERLGWSKALALYRSRTSEWLVGRLVDDRRNRDNAGGSELVSELADIASRATEPAHLALPYKVNVDTVEALREVDALVADVVDRLRDGDGVDVGGPMKGLDDEAHDVALARWLVDPIIVTLERMSDTRAHREEVLESGIRR